MYHDKIGTKNLTDKQAIEKAMHQRRLVFHSLEADLAESERLYKRDMRRKAKKLANMGT